jgi:hypothetical protein
VPDVPIGSVNTPHNPLPEVSVALQGTLDTFALPDVLRLLASTKKSGRLLVQGDRGSGSLWLHDGGVVNGEASMAATDTSTDVLFELLRLEDGSFLFDPDDLAASPTDPTEVEGLITDSQQLFDEWRELAQTIPSLDVTITLADDLPDEQTVVTRERWRHLVAIGHGTTVRQLGETLDLRELPVCRAVSGLIDDGLIVISTDAAAPASARVDSDLPTLGDAPDEAGLFGDDAATDDLPEPLPGDSGGAEGEVPPDPFVEAVTGLRAGDGESLADVEPSLPEWPDANPEQRARVAHRWEQLTDDERAVLVVAARKADPVAIDAALDVVPDGHIDREVLRQFLLSVRN